MTDLQEFAKSRLVPKGKLAPHVKDIQILRGMGLTYRDIKEFLESKEVFVSIEAISKCLKRNKKTYEKKEVLPANKEVVSANQEVSPTSKETVVNSEESTSKKRAAPKRIFTKEKQGMSSSQQVTPAWLPEDYKHLEDKLY